MKGRLLSKFVKFRPHKIRQNIYFDLNITALGIVGSIGGQESQEFHILSDIGEDSLLTCPACPVQDAAAAFQKDESVNSRNHSEQQTLGGIISQDLLHKVQLTNYSLIAIKLNYYVLLPLSVESVSGEGD
jgi:hypothetical protein